MNNRFCENCGNFLTRNENQNIDDGHQTLETLIKYYFNAGYSNKSILIFLHERHNMHFSLRTLKRRLREYGICRRPNVSLNTLESIMRREICGPSSRLGYRGMQSLLRSKFDIRCSRDLIMELLRHLDPAGIAKRKSRVLKRRRYTSCGANYTWHADGYDKLKPYGLPIHGCVDGFSRKIIWLKVCKSNNNPLILAGIFLEKIKELQIAPRFLRTDAGTENGIMAGIQCRIHDNIGAHRYGSSIANQRIENWWSSLRRRYSGWVIDFFKRKIDNGSIVPGSQVFLQCSWFVFSGLIQRELDVIAQSWNTHYVRKSNGHVVSGIPDQLYYVPGSVGYDQCGKKVTDVDLENIDGLDVIAEEAVELNLRHCDIYEYFQYVVDSENLTWPPNNWIEAERIFDKIISLCI